MVKDSCCGRESTQVVTVVARRVENTNNAYLIICLDIHWLLTYLYIHTPANKPIKFPDLF